MYRQVSIASFFERGTEALACIRQRICWPAEFYPSIWSMNLSEWWWLLRHDTV